MDVLKYPAKAISGVCFRERGRNGDPPSGSWPALMEKAGMAGAERLEHAVHGMFELFSCHASQYLGLMLVAEFLDVGRA
jgi:hypothetical protein